jgi:hypothetical protein
MWLVWTTLSCKTPDADALPGTPEPRTLRRLSVHELQNTIPLVTGVNPTDALARLPPDAMDDGYDRVAEAQTVSLIHLEAFATVADAVAHDLLVDGRLDDITPACPDDILPPPTASTTSVLPATSLTGAPGWALTVADDHLYFLYSDDVTVDTTWAAPAAGTYRVTFPIVIDNTTTFPNITLAVNGAIVASWTGHTGAQDLVADVPIADAGSVALELHFGPETPWWSENGLEIGSPTVEGPVDAHASAVSERQACADALAPALAERAWRRPPTSDEVARLGAVWTAALADGTAADGFRMIVEAILESPNFLYLVEVGTEESPGKYRLTDWEQASRLSYALCEVPPDATLVAAARAGALNTPEQIEGQATRLLDAPCGHATVARFHEQWLKLSGLRNLARDPTYYPDFDPAIGPAMLADTTYFFDQMVYDQKAGLQAEFEARQTWVGPETATLYGMTASTEHTRIDMPDDRAGPLTQPALLTATSKFSETSPVLRGVFVLRNLLCVDLAPPPTDLDTTPPVLDDAMTTRERWAAHSADKACSGCHSAIDPIGFTLEGFDALGRARSEENGMPIDTSGGIPKLGLEDLTGGREVSDAVAASAELRHCFARQWVRFGAGHLEGDADPIHDIDAASADSVHDALLTLTRSAAFRYRVVPEELP